MESLLGWEWGPGRRASGLSLYGSDERRFLSADEGSRSGDDLDVETELSPKNVLPEQSGVPGLVQRLAQPLHGEGVFGPHVDDALRRSHRVRADDYPLDQHMGIGLDFVAVHVGAGIAFVGVAYRVCLALAGEDIVAHDPPLLPGGEAGATPSPEPGFLHFVDDGVRSHGGESLEESGIAAHGDILIDLFGIDEAAVAEHELFLALEKGQFLPRRQEGEILAEVQRMSPEVP